MKMVTLECGHKVGWAEWGGPGQEDFPWVGRFVFCSTCLTDHEIVDIDPDNYNVPDDMILVCYETAYLVIWQADTPFENPIALLDYLEIAAKGEYVAFGETVFATPRGLRLAMEALEDALHSKLHSKRGAR